MSTKAGAAGSGREWQGVAGSGREWQGVAGSGKEFGAEHTLWDMRHGVRAAEKFATKPQSGYPEKFATQWH